ncbi:MAG: hypothetical protein GC205_10500 [Bacteroidetes bacterium]|nr:hypothetical protein [Bacteroidota bacterium]
MRTLPLLAVLVFTSLTFTRCTENGLCRRGQGPLVEETRILPSFSKLEVRGAIDVTLIPNDTYQIVIYAQANVINAIESSVSGSELILDLEECFINRESIHVEVYAPVFEAVQIKGSSDLDAAAPIVTPAFSLQIEGSADAVLELETDLVAVAINGSGDVALSGSASQQVLDIDGSGTVNAFALWTAQTTVQISGSGTCRVYAQDELGVRINGSGTVYYKGFPTITELVISGSGELIDAN